MAFFEGIAEVLLEFFGDIVFELALKPFLKHTGIVFRWLCWLGTKKYEEREKVIAELEQVKSKSPGIS